MGIGHNTIAFHQDKCDGCGDCMTVCAEVKSSNDNIENSRIKIVPSVAANDSFELALCRQCGDPKCVLNCPSGSLTKDQETGLVPWEEDKCVDCLLCTVGCAYGGITYNAAEDHVMKCDMCDGDPVCVKSCPTGALEYNTSAEIYNTYGEFEDMFVPGLTACQGCNSELLIRHTMRKMGSNVVVATPPGCIAGMGTVGYNGKTGTKVPVFHPLLTNTASMLAGTKRYYNRIGRDVTMVALAGDGGTVDVGFQSLSGCAERGEQMLFICVDNEGYMNTGMQRSGSTSFGSWTSTTPVGDNLQGKTQDAKNMPVIMMMHNCEYVATASLAFMDDYYEKLQNAMDATKRGMAYLHVYSPCPTGWRFPSASTNEVCRKAIETNFATLWDYTPEQGLRFTRSPDNPLPVEEYLDLSGKYRHLDEAQLEHIQNAVDKKVAFLNGFMMATSGGESDSGIEAAAG
ncbi:MAG: thiamine pyrophosphate-dependent enzyme [Rhodospirillales bacterium]|nr:phenylglyoxylate dehydrogenase [Rhodospirillaceae bacterium]MDP6109424.1 thiamine pyrophosphate-dependent enzyme [Rhodospirillales bacterium]